MPLQRRPQWLGRRVAGRRHTGDSRQPRQTWHRPRGPLLGTVGGELFVFHVAGRFRSWSARRGLVALESASGLRREIGAEHALGLGAQELGPAGADPARRRAETRDAQRGRDGGGGDVDSELQQLALDAHIAPARVLPRDPEDHAACLGRKRRTTRPAAASSAFALQQRPVPAAERLRADRKARPPLAWKQPAHRGKQRTVSGRVLRPPPAAPQDRHLVAQNHDLELALTAAAGEQTNDTAEEPVQHAGQQDAQSEPLRPSPPAPPSRPNRVSLPHRLHRRRYEASHASARLRPWGLRCPSCRPEPSLSFSPTSIAQPSSSSGSGSVMARCSPSIADFFVRLSKSTAASRSTRRETRFSSRSVLRETPSQPRSQRSERSPRTPGRTELRSVFGWVSIPASLIAPTRATSALASTVPHESARSRTVAKCCSRAPRRGSLTTTRFRASPCATSANTG